MELYRRGREAEQVFDEIKNKLREKKARASSLVARETQAQWVALTYNLPLINGQTLDTQRLVTNQAEDKRRSQRTAAVSPKCAATGRPLSTLVLRWRRRWS